MNKSYNNVGLFVSCLVDLTRPSVGFSAMKLLDEAKCKVTIPSQACCGQPAYNSGNKADAKEIAKATIQAFEHCDAVIVPSASCAGMLRHHYTSLFDTGTDSDQKWLNLANKLSQNTFELIDFLYNEMGQKHTNTEYNGRIAYHESCSALREMKVRGPRELLATIEGAEIIDLAGNEECCGFGGLFSVKFDEISNAMVEKKVKSIKDSDIDLLTGVDLGCLMNIAGKLTKQGSDIRVCHIAELLAGDPV